MSTGRVVLNLVALVPKVSDQINYQDIGVEFFARRDQMICRANPKIINQM